MKRYTRRKLPSLRRCKARARLGRWVSKYDIVRHRLHRWFKFTEGQKFREYYRIAQ